METKRSSRSALIILIIIIVAAAGAYLLTNLRGDGMLSYRTPDALAKTSGVAFDFKYPKDYVIKDGSWYTDENGKTYIFAKVMKSADQKDNDFVTVSTKAVFGNQTDLSCRQLYSRCREFGTNIVFTKSQSPKIFNLYETITSNIRFRSSGD